MDEVEHIKMMKDLVETIAKILERLERLENEVPWIKMDVESLKRRTFCG